jgi:hypothetical protein
MDSFRPFGAGHQDHRMLGLQQDVGTGSPARTKAASTPRAESKGSKILELIWACPIRVLGRHEISQARSDAAPKKAAISGDIGSCLSMSGNGVSETPIAPVVVNIEWCAR